MKLRFIYFLLLSLIGAYILQSSRTGVAATFNLDRTGSPIANGVNCGACHNGAVNNAAMTIRVLDVGGNPITTYMPGSNYTVEFNVTSNFGFARGMQAVALTGANAQAGTFSAPQANTQISPLNGRQYVEHTTPVLSANGFVFRATWTAPAAGTGNVTIYASGIVGNGNNATSGDEPIPPLTLVLNEQAGAATINYAQTNYCQAGTNFPSPTISGVQGGTFSAAPAGLTVNANTGQINLGTSVPGTYTVTYTYAGGTATDQVIIDPADNPSFAYQNATYCTNDADPTPIITGLPGGTFAGSAGLVINSSTGTIDISATPVGSYVVGYFTNGPCPNNQTVTINITNLADPSFSYGQASYCQNDPDPNPTAATPGGIYSSTSGLVISSNTGVIDLSASTPGTYTVTYNTGGSCANTSTQQVTIGAPANASFSYSASAYCVNSADPTPTITGVGGGSFSSTNGLSINSSTGRIDVSASTPGTYTVSYTTTGTCPNVGTQQVTIRSLDNASFAYSNTAYCRNGSDPTPTITGLGGGTFSSTNGLSINSSTGRIDVSASTAGTYIVTYTTNGNCPNSATRSVTINAADNSTFAYGASSYCQNANDPTPNITTPGGTFNNPNGLAININTGTIDLSASTPGSYTVIYTTNGACPASSSNTVLINAPTSAAFSYSSNSYCQTASDPTPTVTGTPGGTFSSALGLALNANTGLIDVSASVPGTYTVTYAVGGSCPSSSTRQVVINALDNAGFSYSQNAYCTTSADPNPTLTGLSGGTFSSSSGLSINASSGQIDVSASTPGTYTVTYTTNGPCPNSSTRQVTINGLDNASFSYSSATYCQNGSNNPTPTVTGLGGGTFGASTGLSINTNTGAINLANSTPGVYTVTYVTNGSCPNSSSRTVTITAPDNAGFSYANAIYCRNGADPTPTVTGLTGGTFSSGGTPLVINPSTGRIDVSASPQGTYVVTYTTNGPCPSSSTRTVNLINADDATFAYTNNAYCVNGSPNPTPSILGITGGSFSSTPVGLSLNSNTGTINLANSTPGTYTVTYATNGSCPNSSAVQVVINSADNASFTYSAPAYCQTDPDPTPTGIVTSGSFSSAPSGLSINSSTGRIDVSASVPGTYTITYTTSGTCPNTATRSVTINSLDDATFIYAATGYCRNGNDPTPNILGLSGGSFTSTPNGLSINPSTGEVDLSASALGLYAITYTTNGACPNASTVSLEVDSIDNANFNYSASSYCQNGTDPTPVITGLSGGSFSSTSPNLAINPNTGTIDLSASLVGTYTVAYTTAGNCSNTASRTVTINAAEDASFSYSTTTFCVGGNSTAPVITGNTGGTFTGSFGLVINSNTGIINLGATPAGTYTVSYTTSGTCPDTDNVTVTINPLDNASFSYAVSSICATDPDPIPTITGLGGGTFSSAPAGLVINPSTGTVDASASNPGTYSITYTTNGACPNNTNVSMIINASDDPSFSYNAPGTCVGGADLSATILGRPGGTFSSTAGLALNSTTGLINASSSQAGTYVVTYTTNGVCPASTNLTVTLTARDNAVFGYGGAAFCNNGGDPTPSINQIGGTFSSTPAGLSINPTTGEIDVDNSVVGNYTVSYVTNGTCPDSSTQPLAITASQTASFNYTDTSICLNGAGNATIVVNSSTSGQFSATPAGLDIDPTTGVINAATSNIGTYTVVYTTSGPCATSASTTVIASICGNVTALEAPTYTLYPNPNTGRFTIAYNGTTERVQVMVMDALGKTVHYQEVELDNGNMATLELPNIVSGTYWVRLQDAQQTQVQKMVIAQP